jgi:CheY-like chemotaxis protein
MTNHQEMRHRPDRRQQPRGGRRLDDVEGYAPMVFVVDDNPRNRDISEAILAKLRFAVAPFDSVDKAISVMQALRPEVVVAKVDHIDRLRRSLDVPAPHRIVALVPIAADQRIGESLVEDIRRALSTRAITAH